MLALPKIATEVVAEALGQALICPGVLLDVGLEQRTDGVLAAWRMGKSPVACGRGCAASLLQEGLPAGAI